MTDYLRDYLLVLNSLLPDWPTWVAVSAICLLSVDVLGYFASRRAR